MTAPTGPKVLVPSTVSGLEPFVLAGILGAAEVHVAATLARAAGETSAEVLLAAALAVRAPLHGHVCVDLGTVEQTVDGEGPSELQWPPTEGWLEAVARSPLSTLVDPLSAPGEALPVDENGRFTPLVIECGRLYLARHWFLERYVAADLLQRSSGRSIDRLPGSGGALDPSLLSLAADQVRRLFEAGSGAEGPDEDQLTAALAGVDGNFVVISGGPGTGKTTTVARLLAGLVSAIRHSGAPIQIALGAPTGKAALRMTESVHRAVESLGDLLDDSTVEAVLQTRATTIHRLLGRGQRGHFRHNSSNPLPHDIVIVDEVSMVSLSLMAHLLSAIRPAAKVVLVGDPFQLASVEAGAVLGDVVGGENGPTPIARPDRPHGGTGPGLAGSIQVLRTVHRQAADSGVLALAHAIRDGDSDAAIELLSGGRSDLQWIDPGSRADGSKTDGVNQSVVAAAVDAVHAARSGRIESALELVSRTKVLCAVHRGPGGVESWNRLVEDALRSEGLMDWQDWYVGRPVMVTANDYLNHVYNGDVGVAVASNDRFQVWFPRAEANQRVEASRLDQVVTQWAMSIHKSQGSEFSQVVVSLPPPPSLILTRELLYTAVTRAKSQLTLLASEESLRAAVARPVTRASGLAYRLSGPGAVTIA